MKSFINEMKVFIIDMKFTLMECNVSYASFFTIHSDIIATKWFTFVERKILTRD